MVNSCLKSSLTLAVLMSVVSCFVAGSSLAAVYLEDSFPYAVGNLAGQGSWSGGSGSQVAAGSLSYPGLQTPTVTSNKASLPVTASTAYKSFNASAITNGSVYLSFILRQTTLTTSTTGGTVTGLDDDGTVSTASGRVAAPLGVHLKQTNTTRYLVGIRKGTGANAGDGTDLFYAGASFTNNEVVFVVARYIFGPDTGDDTVTLWVNPSTNSFGGSEPAPSVAATNTGNTNDATQLQQVFVRCNSSQSGANEIDDIRVGSTWEDVTPSEGGVTPPATNEPFITQAIFDGTGIILRGTNGTSNGVYQVLSSTDITTPRPSWPPLATNVFDASGNFDCTNPVSPADALRYYTLLVGGQIAPPPVGPSISTQPTNRTAIVGHSASFNVIADGDPTLYYQWYFNTNTLLTDKTNALLSLPSVSTNDAGYYSVIVSNNVNSVVSTQALLTVIVPPSITTDPTNLSVLAGSNATFYATAAGTSPLSYQWFFNTNTPLANATNATLLITNAQSANEGGYSLRVTNVAGSITSIVATLTVNSKPSITNQPQDLTVTVSNNATFTVTALGTSPLRYQWYFKTNTLLLNETNFSLTITNARMTNAGGYDVIITNLYGSTTSRVALLTVNSNSASPNFGLFGFGQATTGGGIIAEGSAGWIKVTNAMDFALAISNKSGTIKVIEITTNLDLGYNEVGPSVQAISIFRSHATPKLHPRLLQTGVSLIDIQNKNGLTIFSANGATIRHATFNIKSSGNIIVRNLKFDEMWEWDEDSKGNYDGNDWDFIDLGNSGTVSNIWIDHCTFTKAYDGVSDIKGGSFNITFSWNKVVGDDSATNSNSFVWQQINALEQERVTPTNQMYEYLRATSGFTPAEIVTIIQGHDKTHLVGANDGVKNTNNAAENAQHSLTFHHQWFQNCWDRCVPRLRGGNVHNYNIYVDDTQALAAKRLRDQHTISSSYSFNPFLNGSISTEGGAILLEKSVYRNCITPLRNNQTEPTNSAYTGKIMALDSIYHFDNTNGTSIDYRGDSTTAMGSTNFGPLQATVIPFSWNLPGNVLPYSYTPDDPSQLLTLVSNYAGSGVLTWAKTNWLKTSYSP
jgi:pectate lyase